VDYFPLIKTFKMDFVGRPEGRRPLEDLGVYRRIILKWIFKTWDGEMDWTDLA
jgi:hypothetical protein